MIFVSYSDEALLKTDPFVTVTLTSHLSPPITQIVPLLDAQILKASSVYSSMADVPSKFMMPSASRPFRARSPRSV
jgi:hypothetical protein